MHSHQLCIECGGERERIKENDLATPFKEKNTRKMHILQLTFYDKAVNIIKQTLK